LSLNGWGSLKVQTNNKFSNGIQMYAGGYLEGCMTWKRIKEHNDNVNQLFFPRGIPESVKDYFVEQDYWLHQMIIGSPQSNFWKTMEFVTIQHDGVIEGYHYYAGPQDQLDRLAFHLINASGDIGDIVQAVNKSARTDWMSLSYNELSLKALQTGRKKKRKRDENEEVIRRRSS